MTEWKNQKLGKSISMKLNTPQKNGSSRETIALNRKTLTKTITSTKVYLMT